MQHTLTDTQNLNSIIIYDYDDDVQLKLKNSINKLTINNNDDRKQSKVIGKKPRKSKPTFNSNKNKTKKTKREDTIGVQRVLKFLRPSSIIDYLARKKFLQFS